MKIFYIIFLIISLTLHLDAVEKEDKELKDLPVKTGFLLTKWCLDNGYFTDCRLESFLCGEGKCYEKWLPGDKETTEFVLYVHDESKTYKVDISKLPRHEIDEAIARNEVKIKGEIKDDTIIAYELEIPFLSEKQPYKGYL